MILARRFAECQFGHRFIFPLGKYIATIDLDGLAKFIGFLPSLREGKQLGAAQADVLTLAVALQAQEPICSTLFVYLQKQPVTVLVGTRTCHSCLNRESRSEEHTSELQSLMRISYAVFCLKKKNYAIHSTIHN